VEEQSNEVQQDQQEVSTPSPEDVVEQLKVENQKLKASMTRQGWELGELRKKAKEFEAKIPKEPLDFIAEPEKAVNATIESHPLVKSLQEERQAINVMKFKNDVAAEHPDHEEVVQDPRFFEWLQASKARSRTYLEAWEGLDPELGKELIGDWKAKLAVMNGASAAQKDKQASDVKAAKVTTGSGNAGKRVYTTVEMQRLQRTDPEAYKQIALTAYAEGRVR